MSTYIVSDASSNRYIDTTGIETVRRDNCELVRSVMTEVLHRLLMKKDVDGAIAYVKQRIADLLQNKIDLSMLIISKGFTKKLEDYDNKQGHIYLAERMRKRDPLTAPNVGDRIPYVVIQVRPLQCLHDGLPFLNVFVPIFVQGAKGAKVYEKVEDPIYVLENSLPIDTQYYLKQQMSKPILRLFSPIMEHPESLFSGAHTRVVKKIAPKSGPCNNTF